MFAIQVDMEKCNGCGACAKVCPKGPRIWRIEGAGAERKAVVVDPSFCLLCGMCVTICPTRAIRIEMGGKLVSVLGTS